MVSLSKLWKSCYRDDTKGERLGVVDSGNQESKVVEYRPENKKSVQAKAV